jgi:hypothetical protein
MREKKYVDQFYEELTKAVQGWEKQRTGVFMAAVSAAASTTPIHMLKALEGNMQSFKDTQAQIGSIAISAASALPSLTNVIREASTSVSLALASMRPYSTLVEQLLKDERRSAQLLRDSITGPCVTAGIAQLVAGNFSLLAECALRTQLSLARIDATSLLKFTGTSYSIFESLQHALTDVALSYRSLWNTSRTNPEVFFGLPVIVTREPTTEVYLATHQMEVSTIDVDVLPEDEVLLAKIQSTQSDFCDLLERVDARLLKLYEGARNAIESGNPDRVRHAAISLRELVTQIIHRLAPDEDFFKWNQDGDNVKDGRPTRKGRLLFICRGINHGPFAEFVDKDVSAALTFLGLFQDCTHAIESSCSDKQLKALLIRMEALLWYIIGVSLEI